MTAIAGLDPSQRQILMNLGNRHVVFGTPGIPGPIRFDRIKDSNGLPRIEEEGELFEARISQSLRVSGMERAPIDATVSNADVELIAPDGNRVLVEVKIRDHDPKRRDLEQGTERLKEAAGPGRAREIWYLNTERLKLLVMRFENSHLHIDELMPLDVWENTEEGFFSRSQVIEEIEDWENRIEVLYGTVQAWLMDFPDLRWEQNRTVTMSEELMQKFAVTDRDLPILDILEGDQVIISFVPRGLWLVGAWGRIDVITRDRTNILVAVKPSGALEWRLAAPDDRRLTKSFDKDAFAGLLKQP